jgi:hypothetical protein
MDAGSIDGVGIDVTPTVALSTRGIEVGITPVVSVVMREMEGTVTFADGTRESEIALWSTHLHAFKGTGMIVVPVARGAVCFVLHDIRIAKEREYLKEYFFFYLCLKSRCFLIFAAMYSTIGNDRKP